MSVELCVTGRYGGVEATAPRETPQAWLARVEAWTRKMCEDTLQSARQAEGENCPALYLRFHPAEAEAEVLANDQGYMSVSARTSGAGPGYYCYLRDVLYEWGQDLGVVWDDIGTPADALWDHLVRFHVEGPATLEQETLDWLQETLTEFRDAARFGVTQWCLSPVDGAQFVFDGTIATALGPRNQEWVQAVLADPLRGVDSFPWWKQERDARYLLNRALSWMWLEVRWRPPASADDAQVLADAIACLELAYQQDPTLDYPWHEWQEMYAALGVLGPASDEVARRAAEHPAPVVRIGYRRGDVRVKVEDGWSLCVPGSFSFRDDEEGGWTVSDGGRSVGFTSWLFRREDVAPPSAEETLGRLAHLIEGEAEEYQGQTCRSRAFLARGGADAYWELTAHVAVPGCLAICTICFVDRADEEWARGVWRSIEYAPSVCD